MTTRSPGPTFARPHVYATRLSASVAFLQKIVQFTGQFMNAAMRSRALSNSSVASAASAYTLRCTVPRWFS